MNINWYPGHMKKTRESIEKNLSMVDIVFELIDARIPISSRNPIIDDILGSKPRIIILNKSDLASEVGNKAWEEYFIKKNLMAVCIDALSGKGIDRLIKLSNELYEDKRQKNERRGIINRPVRVMILGIPNVGKSTLINTLARRKSAKTGNKPGITRSNQWIKTKANLELLDTPGILWPKFEDKKVGLNLAFTGAIKDEILDRESLALKLIESLAENFPNLLNYRYNVEINDKSYLQIMEEIGIKRGALLKGGEIDYTKVSNIILDEFRKGIIGRITLEFPEE
ncbi:MAG: ribosome biogenesis GTPase YlqF [Tissierellia bacterium]|nr:ribosome biogenesis GTPase YlqF [Tissierellia bacterium]